MKFKPYVSYSLLRMAHFRGFNSPKIPRGPRGVGSRSPNPQGMKKCNPRFPESPRNGNRRGIGIPRYRLNGWLSYAQLEFENLNVLYFRLLWRLRAFCFFSYNNKRTRRPVLSTDQALPCCFNFRISWILMKRPWKHFFGSCRFLQGLRS